MKSDPMDDVRVTTYRIPPSQGPGSGKAAWVKFARDRMDNEQTLWAIIYDQTATIQELQAEVALLRDQIAKRKPKGGKPKTDDKTIQRIEAALAGGMSQRKAARLCGVSAMTVSRIAARVSARLTVTDMTTAGRWAPGGLGES